MAFLASILDLLVPPRPSERLLQNLAVDDLYTLAYPVSGMLPYHDPRVTALVWEVKYRANKRALSLAGEFLSQQIIGIAGEELGKPLLVPVPMHKNRRKKRGHNQTELLCTALLTYVDEHVEYTPFALVRTIDTQPQQGLERHKRLKNVRGSMEVTDLEQVRERVCIVLDDVTTTGATLEEARRALLKAGARRVHLVALAQS